MRIAFVCLLSLLVSCKETKAMKVPFDKVTLDNGQIFILTDNQAKWMSVDEQGLTRSVKDGEHFMIEFLPGEGGADVGIRVELDISNGIGRWGYITDAGVEWRGKASASR